MVDADTPLTADERALVATQLASRRSVANRFAAIAGGATSLFLLQWLLAASTGSRRNMPVVVGICVAITLVIGLIIWYFGYRLVFLIAADLEAGKKQRITGKLEGITSQGNTYGETITYVTVNGERFVTRGRFFDRCRGGETIVVDILPRSRVAIAGSVLEDAVGALQR